MFLKNYNNIITGKKENDNLILFKSDKDTTNKIKNIIKQKKVKNLKKKKLKNILKKGRTKDITKHNPYTIDEENPDEKNVLNKIKNIIKNPKKEKVWQRKLKAIINKNKRNVRNIWKHDPLYIDEDKEHVIFNNNVYDENGEEYIPKWKEKQIYDFGKEEGKFEGDKNAYIIDLLDYEPIKKIDAQINELETNNSKKLTEELKNEIEKLKNDNNLTIEQKNDTIDKLKQKINNVQKHHSKNRNIKIKN